MAILSPNNAKKSHKVRVSGKASSCSNLAFCSYGIKSLESGVITAKQLESARALLQKRLKRDGKVVIRVYPHYSVTKKAIGVRMGGGKGGIDHYVCKIHEGTIIFEFDCQNNDVAVDLVKSVSHKLPLTITLVTRKFSLVNEQ
jgi:large subunit ribosomal protein L16